MTKERGQLLHIPRCKHCTVATGLWALTIASLAAAADSMISEIMSDQFDVLPTDPGEPFQAAQLLLGTCCLYAVSPPLPSKHWEVQVYPYHVMTVIQLLHQIILWPQQAATVA